MRAVDTNILVYAHREEFAEHGRALELVRELAEGRDPWALPWPCVYEFVRIVTHARVFDPPTPKATAVAAMRSLVSSSSVVLLSERERHVHWFEDVLEHSDIAGNVVFDARIVALMKEHGVDEILTRDADFERFAGIRVINPFR